MGLGELPSGYNRAVHGPYDPAIFYGKADKPLAEVKLGELPAWLTRRNPSPVAMTQAVSRAYWRWNHKYVLPKYCGLTPMIQGMVGMSALFYVINYSSISHHKNKKYHW